MQEKLTIARPYANAAFRYAEEHDRVDEWSRMLGAVAAVVSDPSLAALIGHPRVSNEQLVELVGDVLGDRIDEKVSNFVRVLVDAGRLDLAPRIFELFERKRAEAAGIVNAEVTSAFPLTREEHERIRNAVSARVGKTCELASRVEQDLIGGAVVKIGDSVLDLSLRRRLSDLAQELV